MDKKLIQTSKFLSLVLRHKPELIGIALDTEGWVDIDVLLKACASNGQSIAPDLLQEVVTQNDKKRFVIRDGRIRANQGHSVSVDLALSAIEPPACLFHGTADRFLESIRCNGLRKMNRQHVHLSPDEATARKVGMRHGRPVILKVRASDMHTVGYVFYCSENGVWLTEAVPYEFVEEPKDY